MTGRVDLSLLCSSERVSRMLPLPTRADFSADKPVSPTVRPVNSTDFSFLPEEAMSLCLASDSIDFSLEEPFLAVSLLSANSGRIGNMASTSNGTLNDNGLDVELGCEFLCVSVQAEELTLSDDSLE